MVLENKIFLRMILFSGELFHVNGEQTPFISKIPVQAPPPPPIVRNQPPPQPLIAGQQSQQRFLNF